MDAVHESFLQSLPASEAAVWLYAHHLVTCGNIVKLLPSTKAPTRKEYRKHSDRGDLFVANPRENRWDRYEVKHREIEFAMSFPFDDIIIDGTYQFDRKDPAPAFYISINQSMTHFAQINVVETRAQWIVKPNRNKVTKKDQDNYNCPISPVAFGELQHEKKP